MAHRDPVHNELFRHTKRKQISLDGTVAGLEPSRMRGGYHFPGAEQRTVAPPSHEQYLSPLPQDYHPHPGFMDLPQQDYEADEPQMHVPRGTFHRDPAPPRQNIFDNQPGIPDYDASLMTDGLLHRALAGSTDQSAPAEPIPYDNPVTANELMHPQDSLEQIMEEPFQQDPMQEIEAAMAQQFEQTEQQMAPEPVPEPMPDPYMEQQQMYDEQMWQMMDPFGMMGPMM